MVGRRGGHGRKSQLNRELELRDIEMNELYKGGKCKNYNNGYRTANIQLMKISIMIQRMSLMILIPLEVIKIDYQVKNLYQGDNEGIRILDRILT